VGRNVVHGSDSPENGERETGGFLYLQQWAENITTHD
jgi:nucleoside diphosphate kinase